MIYNKKFRWIISGIVPNGKLESTYVNIDARPFEKQKTKVQIFGVDQNDLPLFAAIQSAAYDKENKSCEFTLELLDGCCAVMETWKLKKAHIDCYCISQLSLNDPEWTDLEFTIDHEIAEFIPVVDI